MTILNKDFLKKPISEARRRANQANAQKSTGPRTPEGKARSSQNALTHGLTASLANHSLTNPALSSRNITALGEDRNLLPNTIQRFLASWNPATPYEASLVEDLASLRVRLNRCIRIETGLLDNELPTIEPHDSHESISSALAAAFTLQKDAFSVFSRYEAALSRAYDRTLKQLLATRKEKLNETNPIPHENKQPPPPPPPPEPNIRTEPDPPITPEQAATRRHGQPTALPPRQQPHVELEWILEDGSPCHLNGD